MSNHIYVIGHKRPDTDSVSSAIALSNLKNKIGMKTEPRVLGDINKETKYALNYFGLKAPKYLDNVYLQIKDVDYHKDCYIHKKASIYDTYEYILKSSITGVPIVDDNKKLLGLVTSKMILSEVINGDFSTLDTSYDNILKILDGEEVFRFDDEIKGNVISATFRSTKFMDKVELHSDDILIVGDRHSIIEYAVLSKIKLLIILGNAYIKEEHLSLARKNRVNIIRTTFDSYNASRMLGLSNYVINLCNSNEYFFDEDFKFSDFLDESARLKHNNYPVINKNNRCLGLIRVTDIMTKNKKKVILVDHNELEQSVDGIEEAEIMEIVDHHKIGDLTTNNPINFRNMAVGSSNTIIYYMYQDMRTEIDPSIAGIMLSGILSDTLNLTSPTTTDMDKYVVQELGKIAGVDPLKYGIEMLKAGSSLEGLEMEDVINMDNKVFPIGDQNISVAQIFSFNTFEVLKDKEVYKEALESYILKNGLDGIIFLVTDVLENSSYVLYSSSMAKVLMDAFPNSDIVEGFKLEGVVSRKKQVVPTIMDALEGR